ncbi:class I SAM-dependent methyltransferase [Acetivibrio cellulolyticus]|uniref:SAM-dependent methyltransferase n=1 Tax=Acetivibrio cellulolyticus TaxID=35830 RepID=UPI0001E3059F|nr:SAM-dependent methyltransferase [Acetivibrio cellulolyticus]
MRNFSKEMAQKILMNKIDTKSLALQYPEFKDMVIKDFSQIKEGSSFDEVRLRIDKYKAKASFAVKRIHESGFNEMTVNSFLPDIIKARIALDTLEQLNLSAQAGKSYGKVRFNLWDGWILQKVLFKKGFERKPVSLLLFKLVWPFITNKKILLPMVNKKGIYCFYSKKLLKELANLIGDLKCIEIGAGDGTLTRFLKAYGVSCLATDDYSWNNYIQYPDYVEKIDAKEALNKYKPDVVICSWAPPGNAFEKTVFKTESVKLYIAIGTKNHALTGNYEAYQNQDTFDMELSQQLSSLVLPQSKDNAVYIFKRKVTL